MTTEHLKHALIELRGALASGQPLDAELTALLTLLDSDIRARLLGKTEGTHEIEADDSGLTRRAQEISAKFAARHPHLEPVLRELTDTLNRIGI